ncbi:MAG: efflux transporter, family, subunit [Armatimonadetes bacterium]|jgi:multidrug efflux pump subunit AcrA (membrane-fusion protein)|nr:efflux transporter, family, subunit [Armatimonadota bacterium]
MNPIRTIKNWRTASARERRGVLVGVGVLLVLLLVGRAGYVRSIRANSDRGAAKTGRGAEAPSVDVVLARLGTLQEVLEYTGTTRPGQEITLRSRAEGRLLSLAVDVGDRVRRGQELGSLDSELLRTAVRQAEAELASRQSEAAAARTQVADAQTQVQRARLDLQQRKANFKRTYALWGEGYESRQAAEQALTAEQLARQVLRSAEQQVKSAAASVQAAEGRISAQRAVLAQTQERMSFASLRSPIDGAVTARFVQAGDLVQPGAEVVRLGNFQLAQVDVQVSELELGQVSVGQEALVQLDALGGELRRGRVDRISPQADPVSRVAPVTVTLPNPDARIGAGMLARVRFTHSVPDRVLIPEAALQAGERRGGGASGGPRGAGPASPTTAPDPRAADGRGDSASDEGGDPETAKVFVVVGEGRPLAPRRGDEPESAAGPPTGQAITQRLYSVQEREIRIGVKSDGQVEVLSGLKPGERVVSRSSAPLREGLEVRPSVLSVEAFDPKAAAAAQAPGGRRPGESAEGTPSERRGTGAPTAGDPGRPASPAQAGNGTSPGAGPSPRTGSGPDRAPGIGDYPAPSASPGGSGDRPTPAGGERGATDGASGTPAVGVGTRSRSGAGSFTRPGGGASPGAAGPLATPGPGAPGGSSVSGGSGSPTGAGGSR